MLTGQEHAAPFYCPRCGGLMYKPTGSSFYWHADNNHPHCEITNLPASSRNVAVASADDSSETSSRERENRS